MQASSVCLRDSHTSYAEAKPVSQAVDHFAIYTSVWIWTPVQFRELLLSLWWWWIRWGLTPKYMYHQQHLITPLHKFVSPVLIPLSLVLFQWTSAEWLLVCCHIREIKPNMTQPVSCQSILSKTIIRTSTKEAYFANTQKKEKRVGKVRLYRHLFHFFCLSNWMCLHGL